MTGIFYALIILPLIFFILLALIFTSSVHAISLQEFYLNCPYPLYNDIATLGNPAFLDQDRRLNYTTTAGTGNQTNNGTYFRCTEDPITHKAQASTISKPYAATLGNCSTFCIAYGYLGFASDSITSFFGKVQPFVTIIYLILNAPSIVTGLSWFAYINVALLFMIALGILMVIRG